MNRGKLSLITLVNGQMPRGPVPPAESQLQEQIVLWGFIDSYVYVCQRGCQIRKYRGNLQGLKLHKLM